MAIVPRLKRMVKEGWLQTETVKAIDTKWIIMK
jgi:hypothetical protein